MRSFTDIENREWDIKVTVGSINRIKSRCNIDLLDFGKDGFLKTLIEDPRTLARVLWCLLEKQSKEQGISEEDLADGLSGDVIAIATKAFLDDLIDFFQGSKKTAAMTVLAKTNDMVEMAYADVAEKAEKLDVEKIYQEAIKSESQQTK